MSFQAVLFVNWLYQLDKLEVYVLSKKFSTTDIHFSGW